MTFDKPLDQDQMAALRRVGFKQGDVISADRINAVMDENDALKALLAEALEAWEDNLASLHGSRCSHMGGVEACDPELAQTKERAKALGVTIA